MPSGRKIVSGIGWNFAERILAQGVSFVVSVVLARLILPEEYGVVALVLVFINIADVLVTNGLGEALIQRKKIVTIEYSTVFWMSLIMSIILYGLIFFVAPYISSFYNEPILTVVLRVLSIKLLFSAINTVQQAYVSKQMIFKKFFFATLGGTVISAIAGIIMAYNGFGVWALVTQYLVNSFIDTLILQLTTGLKLSFAISKDAARELFDFGWKLTVSALITTLYNELRSIIIGKTYSSAELAYYNKGNQLPSILINNINTAIGKVFFPSMVELNDNKDTLKRFTRQSIYMSSYVLFPLMIGLIAVAKPLVVVLFTDRWVGMVPFLQIMCMFWILQPIQTANWQVLKALGRSDLCVKLELIKKAIGIVLIFLTMNISIYALALSAVLFSAISSFINMIPVKRLINYTYKEQIVDIIPATVASIIMGVGVWSLSLLDINIYLMLSLQIMVGIVLYTILSKILKIKAFNILIKTIKNMIK